ncbi:transglycosylase SLT domain-containing protein [Haliangium sp.]|uniref:transglycosylase SLT domain-containing protein n=1 Tax=Haliangium sp. TaxID=2663208 RepID=UPI003D0E2591
MFLSHVLSRAGLTAAAALAAACSSACSTDEVAGTRTTAAIPSPAAAAPAPAAPSPPASLTADTVAPYFRDGLAGEAAKRFALEDWRAARDGFAAHLGAAHAAPMDEREQARLRLLIAIADTHLDAWERAAEGFSFAAERLPLIADYIHYHAARAYYFAHDADAAMAHARRVTADAPDSIVGADAELLIGDLLRGAERWSEMAAHYESYLRRRPRGIRRAEARYRLAEALDRSGDAQQALIHYRTITVRAPLSPWAEPARERMDALLPTRPEAERDRLTTLSAQEYIERGMAYFGAMRNPLSEADFEAALSAPGLTPKRRCVASYHRAKSVLKARDRKRAAPLFDLAIADCDQAGETDLQVKAAYNAGQSYAFIDEHEEAAERYRRAETIDPKHTYCDDARLRQAEEYTSLGEEAKVTELLSSIPKLYPQGDMRAEAMWRLGWRAYREGRFEEAVGWFRKQVETMPLDRNWWAEGQAQYWQGRALAHLGRTDESVAAYREAVERYPLSYYALLALNRLREAHPQAFAALRRDIAGGEGALLAPSGEHEAGPALSFKPRPEYGTPGFARALEFLRLGLGQPASAELKRLDLDIPHHRDPITDPDRVDKLWATAFLYDRAGRHELSHWPTRWNLTDYKRHWPTGEYRARWQIAYPRAYWPLLSQHAHEHGFPTELIIAIVREESAFEPLLESYANAIGLTQMIFPTATRFAKGTGIEVSRETLRDPEKNVTIGSRFLGFLWSKWDGYITLIPPSYNAGENAVARWLKARGDLPADEFIESIAGDQARRYSKRVLSSYFTYSYLYAGEIPRLPNVIPKRLIP